VIEYGTLSLGLFDPPPPVTLTQNPYTSHVNYSMLWRTIVFEKAESVISVVVVKYLLNVCISVMLYLIFNLYEFAQLIGVFRCTARGLVSQYR
jgi:hypothetical protein